VIRCFKLPSLPYPQDDKPLERRCRMMTVVSGRTHSGAESARSRPSRSRRATQPLPSPLPRCRRGRGLSAAGCVSVSSLAAARRDEPARLHGAAVVVPLRPVPLAGVTLAGFVCFADNLVASLKCGHGKNLARVHTHVNTHKVTENLDQAQELAASLDGTGHASRPGSTTPGGDQ
jgi:hypothetical protein